MIERVLKTISRYNMLASRDPAHGPIRVAVAVSGGADSVGLLHLMHELAEQLRVQVSVAHFNHRLRGSASDEDEAFTADLAARLGLVVHRDEADVAAFAADANENLEQAARNARRDFFSRLREKGLTDFIATGHTRDDQAETVLFRILRGAGLGGFAGILPVTEEGLIRPVLDVSRLEIREYLRRRGIEWREDASNQDPRFARNRIRNVLIPQLEADWNPNLSTSLAHLADLALEEERLWTGRVRKASADFVEWNGGFDVPLESIEKLPRALARRVIRRGIAMAKGNLRRIGFEHVEQVLELASRIHGDGGISLPGLEVKRSFGWLRLAVPGGEPGECVYPVSVPGEITFASRTIVKLEREETPLQSAPGEAKVLQKVRTRPCGTLKAVELAGERLPQPLELRGWRSGDHYQPVGDTRDRKVSEMFERLRVPSWRRRFWPMLVSGGEILWAREFGPASRYAVSDESGWVLRISEVYPDE